MYSFYFLQSLISASSKPGFAHHLLAIVTILVTVRFIFDKIGIWVWWQRKKRQARLISKFPGLRNMFPFSSYLQMLNLAWYPASDSFPWICERLKENGHYFVFWLAGQPLLFISDSDVVIQLLQNPAVQTKSQVTQDAASILGGETLVTMDPAEHAPRRKMWRQGLNRKHIDNTLQIFTEPARSLCNSIKTHADNNTPIDMMWPCIYTTFQTIAWSAFGADYMSRLSRSVALEQIHALHEFSNLQTKRIFNPWLLELPQFLYLYFTWNGYRTRKCKQTVLNLAKAVVEERRLFRKSEMDASEIIPCFTNLLLDYHEKGVITETEMLLDLTLFVAGGYDTSGLTILWLLYLLSLHPQHQEKVVEELVGIFGTNIRDWEGVTPAQVRQMKYLELCLKESQRFYPISPMFFRRASSDVELPDGRVIPEGTDVYICNGQVHQDPKYFPNPEQFVPERHQVSIAAFMPFSQGSRNCIGQVYAMQEVKIIAAHLLLEYKWTTLEKPGLQPLVFPFSVPESGIKFLISKRFKN